MEKEFIEFLKSAVIVVATIQTAGMAILVVIVHHFYFYYHAILIIDLDLNLKDNIQNTFFYILLFFVNHTSTIVIIIFVHVVQE